MKWQQACVAGISLCISGAIAVASQEGINAFKRGDYEQALADFQHDIETGAASDSVNYNLGVTLYRLGRFAEARTYFEDLANKSEWQALAWYNLGLVAEQLGNREEAQHYFTKASEQNQNGKVAGLAEAKTKLLEDAPKRASTDQSKWLALVSADAGYDSNAISLADDLSQGNRGGDNYLEVLGYAQKYMTGHPKDGVKFYALAFTRQYEKFDSVDSNIFAANVSWEQPWGEYDTEVATRILHTQLDGREVANQLQVKVGASRELALGLVSASYLPSRIFAADKYQQIDGWQHRFDFEWRKAFAPVTLKARYRFEINDREDLTNSTGFSSYSPTRNEIKGEVSWQLRDNLKLGFNAEHQASDYSGVNVIRDTDGEIKSAARVNHRSKVGAEIEYRVLKPLTLSAGAEYVISDDTFALYEYDKTRIGAAVQYKF